MILLIKRGCLCPFSFKFKSEACKRVKAQPDKQNISYFNVQREEEEEEEEASSSPFPEFHFP